MEHKQIFSRWLPVLLLVLMAWGCSRYGDDVTTSETDVVSTIRDENTNFSDLTKTYAIVDKINIADDPDNEIDSTQFWAVWNDPVLNAINSNLSSLGYTKEDVSANPALFINVTANVNVNSGTVWYPGWWWGYYPCYPYYYILITIGGATAAGTPAALTTMSSPKALWSSRWLTSLVRTKTNGLPSSGWLRSLKC